MHRFYGLAIPFLLMLAIAAGCGGGDDDDDGSLPQCEEGPETLADSPAPECDAARRPLVLAHGFLASADTYANHAMRFAANGYCLDRIYGYDWNTLTGGAPGTTAPEPIERLDDFIDDVLAATGADRVDLAGHSAGGGLGAGYLSDPIRAAKVAHYAHLASFQSAEAVGPPWIQILSEDDRIIDEKGDIPGALNVNIPGNDHLQVATVAESFAALYEFFTDGQSPQTTEILPELPIDLSGRALTLGENIPAAGAAVDIYGVDPHTGERDCFAAHLTTDSAGYWGPFHAQPETRYEFFVQPEEGLPLHYYREPFVRSNPLVYLRTLPGPGSLVASLLSILPLDASNATLVTFTANQAAINGRDTLTVDGGVLTTPELASADKTLIAAFHYDANENGRSDFVGAGGLFESFPFLGGFDVALPTETRRSIPVIFNGRVLNVPNWSTNVDGPTLVVFD